jgi:hypothetical protein
MYYLLPPTHHSELCAGQNNTKIYAGLSTSRSLVFKMKKLLYDSGDLMLWPRDRKK